MAAEKGNDYAREHSIGNIYAQKYTPEMIIDIITDIIRGLVTFQSYDSTVDSVTSEIKEEGDNGPSQTISKGKKRSRVIEGYSCLYRGLISNHIYDESKLHEWAKTHKDNKEVSQAIDTLLKVGKKMIVVNSIEGHYDPRIATFLLERVAGYTEENAAHQLESEQNDEEILIGYEDKEDFDEWEEFEKGGIIDDTVKPDTEEVTEESKPDQETAIDEDND